MNYCCASAPPPDEYTIEPAPDEEALLEKANRGEQNKAGLAKRTRCACCCCLITALLLGGLLFALYAHVQRFCIGPAIHDSEEVNALRPKAALEAELERREAAKHGPLLTFNDINGVNKGTAAALIQNAGTSAIFPYFNFVQGFKKAGCLDGFTWWLGSLFGTNSPRWMPPVKDEKLGLVTFEAYAKEHYGVSFNQDFFKDYYTGEHIPSWEDNGQHKKGVTLLDASVAISRRAGIDPISQTYPIEPRVAFDQQALTLFASNGFRYFGPMDIKYASNGFYGASVVERKMQNHGGQASEDVLGLLMTESVFGAHLTEERSTGLFHVDLTEMAKYKPIPGYAPLGGKASFVRHGNRLRTVRLEYNGSNFTDFNVKEVKEAWQNLNTRSGWRMAEGAFIASLLSQTNLVTHVKDLHLELAATFQAVTVDTFAQEPKHPVRRLLDAFISRSVQATNDNFRLLFDYHAADFSLAPLPHEEQLKLIAESIKKHPLNMANLDMANYGKVRNMDPSYSTKAAITNTSGFGWRWHYRALTVQKLLEEYIGCFLDAEGFAEFADDSYLMDWWQSMVHHLPSLRRATEESPEWASVSKMNRKQFLRVVSTIMVWVSWIHEDVGHSAAAYVYNPMYTPMCVPEDGVGVPLNSWVFNAMAYRGFVFLHRSTLLQEPPDFWFDGNKDSKQCYGTLQEALRTLGQDDIAFSECDQNGFYSCVDRVETAVSS